MTFPFSKHYDVKYHHILNNFFSYLFTNLVTAGLLIKKHRTRKTVHVQTAIFHRCLIGDVDARKKSCLDFIIYLLITLVGYTVGFMFISVCFEMSLHCFDHISLVNHH